MSMLTPLEEALLGRATESGYQMQTSTDPEGRRLSSRIIVGQDGHGLSPDNISSLTKVLVDRSWQGKAPEGVYEALRATKGERGGEDLQYYSPPPQWDEQSNHDLVPMHEVGHLIDLRSNMLKALDNQANKDAITEQLAHVSQGYAPERGGAFEPGNLREQLADSVARYMQNPDQFKRMAPDLARFIRDIVNTDPVMNQIITFSSLETPNRGVG